MTEKQIKPKRTTKTQSFSIRFDRELYEKIKERFSLETAQQVVDVMQKIMEQTFFPIVGIPTMERQDSHFGNKATQVGKKIPANKTTTSVGQSGDTSEDANQMPVKGFKEYEAELRYCNSIEELEIFKDLVCGDQKLNSKQRDNLCDRIQTKISFLKNK